MIVSEEHRYAFVQLPHTGCTAVGHELVEYYGGSPILEKHASYRAFRRWAGSTADEYFVFATVRNPMDEVVSVYHKFRNDHKGHYSNPANWKKNGGWLSNRGLRQFLFIRDNNASFQDYFKKFFVLPYVNTSVLVYGQVDFVMRFERLEEDFSSLVDRLGLSLVRPLPVMNPTLKDDRDFVDYYEGVESRARRIFGPMNRLWGYDFPEGWKNEVPAASEVAFAASRFGRTCFWNLTR